MTQPINQHYVPQWYQEGFADPGDRKKYVWFRRIGTKKPWAQTITRNLCSENFFNAFKDEKTGKWNHGFDEFVGKIENAREIVALKVRKQELLSIEDREKLALFASMLYQGVPYFRNTIAKHLERVGDKMLQLNYQKFMKNPALLEDYKKRLNLPAYLKPEHLDPKHFRTEAHKGHVMSLAFDNIAIVAQMIFDMGWAINYSKSEHTFITTDRPVVLFEPNPNYPALMGVGLASPTAVLQLPLSKNHLLFASHAFGKEKFAYVPVPEKMVEVVNIKQAMYADRTVISATKSFPGHEVVNKIIDAREGSDSKL